MGFYVDVGDPTLLGDLTTDRIAPLRCLAIRPANPLDVNSHPFALRRLAAEHLH
jgi:hypothetical protein